VNKASASGNLFRFGDFELDLGAYQLRRAGEAVRLEQQPMDLLALLVQRQPHLVTRAEIIERLWGTETFVDADAGINTAVRKVRKALQDSASSPRFIERVPGKGYRFVAAATSAQPNVSLPAASRRRLWLAGVAALLVLLVASGAFMISRPAAPAASALAVPLTRFKGVEREPTLSPEGTQVAFAWDSENEDNFDIYVMVIGDTTPKPLTTDPAPEFAPQWSPDGRFISYVRVQPGGTWHQLRVMSALGGGDRPVSDFPAWYQSSWSPDGKHLAAGRAVLPGSKPRDNGIYLVPLEGGDARPLTFPETGRDYSPAFSPDGRHLAYAACRDTTFSFDCHVRVLDLDEGWRPVGGGRQLTRESQRRISGISWSRDGRLVMYAAGLAASRVWRVPADGSDPPEAVPEAGNGGTYPTTARMSDRLVFSRTASPNAIYRFEEGRSAVPVAQSSGSDGQPEFAPDGKSFAFCSGRSGTAEIWVAPADGSSATQVTRNAGREQCSPAWSRDGNRLAYDSVGADGTWQIWTIGVDGSSRRQVTYPPNDHYVPRWSRDGQWILASSGQRPRNIVRIREATGEIQPITTQGSGHAAYESPDGLGILFPASNSDGPLLFQAFAGGASRTILPCIARGSSIAPAPQGIYYLACLAAPATSQPIRLFDPATGIDRPVGLLEEYNRPRDFYAANFRKITVSPDGRSILYQRRRPTVGDLMLIETVR
jgi:Tol biopolymer transport system component/DNA-binding winged helix-turn-helix (wHTH) protein